MLMCRSCGAFVTAKTVDDTVRPLVDECPDCGGQEFKNNRTDEVISVQ